MPDTKAAADATAKAATLLEKGGLARADAEAWLDADPAVGGDFGADATACAKFWQLGAGLRARLPGKAARGADQEAASALVHARERDARDRFLAAHVEVVYGKLTNGRRKFVRAEQLVLDAGELLPGLAPSAEQMERENALLLKDKDGLETDHGILLFHILGHAQLGRHLCHAMLLPRPEALKLAPRVHRDGSIDLGAACLTRMGRASVVELRNPRFLNALDDATMVPLETAVDLALLDPATEIVVLRGGFVEHPKYAGRRVFSAGINLTHLYQGKISFLFYFKHVMGYENKMLRGLARPDASPDDLAGSTLEKPWIAALDTFAIGGGCQHLLVMDYTLAAAGAYMTLPARKEGIIPGMANLRLPRFVGDRIARQAIMYGRRLECDSAEGRLICDEIVPPDEMDTALARVIDGLTSSGMVSAVGNRRQFRIGQETLDQFRLYLARFAKEQAYCHFSQGLIANLERHWNAQNRQS